jgi:hypothetical protein
VLAREDDPPEPPATALAPGHDPYRDAGLARDTAVALGRRLPGNRLNNRRITVAPGTMVDRQVTTECSSPSARTANQNEQ